MTAVPGTGPGESPAVRLMGQVQQYDAMLPLHPAQVAIVCRALADHTALQGAVAYRRSEPDGDDPALAVGRWLHAVADEIRDGL